MRVTFLTHAPTPATAAAAFPVARDSLDERGRAWARSAAGALRRVDRVLHAPTAACRETVALLDLQATTDEDDRWRDWDLGRWAGRTLDDVAAREPDAATAWLSDADAAPHGGEPLTALLARVATALGETPADGHTVVVAQPAIVRAVVVVVLGAPAPGFWRIDVAPLTATELRGTPGRWSLRTTGRPLTDPHA